MDFAACHDLLMEDEVAIEWLVDGDDAAAACSGGILLALAGLGIDASTISALLNDAVRFRDVLRFGTACGAFATIRRNAFVAMSTHAEVEVLMNSSALVPLEVAAR